MRNDNKSNQTRFILAYNVQVLGLRRRRGAPEPRVANAYCSACRAYHKFLSVCVGGRGGSSLAVWLRGGTPVSLVAGSISQRRQNLSWSGIIYRVFRWTQRSRGSEVK